MDKDRFPNLSDPEDDNSLDSILKRSNPQPFTFKSIIPETSLFTQSPETDEDDEEESKDSKKQKKFTQLLKSLFPKTLEEAPKNIETKAVEKIQDHNEIFSDINTPEAYSEAAGINTLADIPELQPEPLAERAEIVQEAEESHNESGIPFLETTEKALVTEDAPSSPVQTPAQSKNYALDMAPPTSAPPVFTERYVEQPKIRKQEIIVEKQKPVGAIIAFLGAEFLSRRRDKKLERSIKKQEKQLTAKIDQVKPKTKGSEPESLASILDRVNYSNHNKTEDFETTPIVADQIDNYPEQITNEQIKATLRTEKLDLPATPRVETEADYRYKNTHEEKHTSKERVISSPDVNVENSFESKKDQPRGIRSYKSSAQNIVGFGEGYKTKKDPASSLPSRKSSSVHSQTQSSATASYRQSMQTGAGVALIILAIFIVVFLIV